MYAGSYPWVLISQKSSRNCRSTASSRRQTSQTPDRWPSAATDFRSGIEQSPKFGAARRDFGSATSHSSAHPPFLVDRRLPNAKRKRVVSAKSVGYADSISPRKILVRFFWTKFSVWIFAGQLSSLILRLVPADDRLLLGRPPGGHAI